MGPWPLKRKLPGGPRVGRGPSSVLGKGKARRPRGRPFPWRAWKEGGGGHAKEEESRTGWGQPLRGLLGADPRGLGVTLLGVRGLSSLRGLEAMLSGVSGDGPLAGRAAVWRTRRGGGPAPRCFYFGDLQESL